METVRTAPPIAIGSVNSALVNNGFDYRYALGHWRECADATWNVSCEDRHVSSRTGAFGWHPWIDFDNGYYGVLAVFEVTINGRSAAEASVAFSQEIQPLIVSALADLRAGQ